MSAINRMYNPVRPASLDEATLADAEVLECPYPTYSLLREQAPVFQDPRTGIWVITRYEDLRMVCLDTERFSNHRPSNDHEKLTGNARKAYELFLERGWVPGESLATRDDPEHKQMRSIFDTAFRPKRIKALDGEVETLAYELIDARFAAGNRDPAQFKRPDDVELERRNAASHLGYSSGTHYCLGAPLARRELYWGFKAFIDNVEDFRLTPGRNDLRHYPNYGLRTLNELHIEFTARSDRPSGDHQVSPSGRDPVDGIGN